MVPKPAKKLLLAAGLCSLLAAELPAQGGLAGPPGRMDGGARSGSAARAARPSGQIPSAVPPPDNGESRSPGAPGSAGAQTSPPRPVGSILFPGTPGRSNPGSILSPGSPGSVGQPSILSPGFPGPYRPGSVLTPGTPRVSQPAPHPGGIYSDLNGTDRFPDSFHGRRGGRDGAGRHGRGVIVYPYVYFGHPYGYGDGGYPIESGAVSRTSSSAHYVIEGHLGQGSEVERRSRVYKVGPGAAGDTAEQGPPDGAERDQAEDAGVAEPPADAFYLIALKGGLIYASREHWLLGSTLHFVTLQGDHYVVSLQEVDMDLSVQLNRERGLKLVLEVRGQGEGAAESSAVP